MFIFFKFWKNEKINSKRNGGRRYTFGAWCGRCWPFCKILSWIKKWCSFSRCEKEPKSVEGCDSLHTTRNAPWRSGARGQQKNNRQKGFVKFWHKTFSFVFLFFVLHETKNLSRVNVFECVRTQTLDKPFCFMQIG